MNEIWVVDYKPGILSGMHIQVGFPIRVSESGGSAIAGWFILSKTQKITWMIWGYHHFRTPSYGLG